MQLSEHELYDLAERFGVTVLDEDADDVLYHVNRNLDGLDRIYELDLGVESPGGDRRWWEPESDPYNAISTACEVPPTDGHSGLLDGMSVGVKDIIAVAGVPMECASGAMQGFVPGFDAAAIERLRAAGATITAKTTLDEFAGGARGVSFDGQIRNPHDSDRSPGGSSGGSAVAVATGIVDAALGTDTGGSVRLPAAYCGIVGLKPSYGTVPNHGVVENTYTLDHVGPMTATVEDSASVLEAIAGKDERDAASMQAAGYDDYRTGGYVDAARDPPAPADIALAVIEEGIDVDEVEAGIVERTEAAVDTVEDAGATVSRVSIDDYELVTPIKNAISYAELVTHWRAGGAPYRRNSLVDGDYQVGLARRAAAASGEVNPYYRARLLAGAHLVADRHGRHYTHARAARETYKRAFDGALDGVDALIAPTTPTVARPIEEARDPGYNYARNTKPGNLTGFPAISIPNGTVEGLPVGLQLMGRRFRDANLLGVAAAIELLVGE